MICAWYRWKISRAADERRAPEGALAAHLAVCPECRRFHAACETLGRRLAAPSPVETELPLFLHERIVAASRAASPAPAPAGHAWAWAAAAAMAALALVLLPLARQPAPGPTLASAGDLYERGLEALVTTAPASLPAPMEEQVAWFREDLARTARFLMAQVD